MLFVLGDVSSWSPIISDCIRWAYPAYLDPWYAGIVLLCLGWFALCVYVLQSESCVSQWLCQIWRASRTSLASREGGCGVVGQQDLRMKKKRGDIADLMPQALEKTFRCWGQRLSKKGRMMRASSASCWLVDTLGHLSRYVMSKVVLIRPACHLCFGRAYNGPVSMS